MAKTEETKPAEQPTQQVVTVADLATILKTFAEEVKKPTLEEQEKLAEVKAKKLAAQRANIKAWEGQRDLKVAQQASCRHIKENGKHNFVGQIYGNGLTKAMCQVCHWESDWFEPFPEMLNGGAEFKDYSGLTRAIIEEQVAKHKAKQQVAV